MSRSDSLDLWRKAGLLTAAEADAQLRELPPGITAPMVDAAFDALGGRVSKLEVKRALFAAFDALPLSRESDSET